MSVSGPTLSTVRAETSPLPGVAPAWFADGGAAIPTGATASNSTQSNLFMRSPPARKPVL
jgi:hypothetical protein